MEIKWGEETAVRLKRYPPKLFFGLIIIFVGVLTNTDSPGNLILNITDISTQVKKIRRSDIRKKRFSQQELKT